MSDALTQRIPSKKERDDLEALSRQADAVIKPADKGGGIVVMNKERYIVEGIRQLPNAWLYQHLEADPTPERQRRIRRSR